MADLPASLHAALQLVLQGVTLGAIYGLVALGLLLVWRTSGLVNFAHGDLLLVAAFAAWWLLAVPGLAFWLAAILVVAGTGLLCVVLETGLLRRVAGQPHAAGVLLTLGIGAMLRGGTSLVFGPETRTYATPWSGRDLRWSGWMIGELQAVILAACLGLMAALAFWLNHTPSGAAARGLAQNRALAQLSGVPVRRLTTIVFGGAGALAAVAGLLLAPITLVDMNIRHVFFKGLAAVVLGAPGGVAGTIAAAAALGIAEQVATRYCPDGTAEILTPVLIIAALAWRSGRPAGTP